MNRSSIYLFLIFLTPLLSNAQVSFSVDRFRDNPIITPHMLKGYDGDNINGPSLIKVPDWVKNPLGKYYLYFAHHKGKYIRMAYSDSLKGLWKIYHPGVLNSSATVFGDDPDEIIYTSGPNRFMYSHIASPEVIVDEENKLLRMYFHGRGPNVEEKKCHCTSIATSDNGLDFSTMEHSQVIKESYFRIFIYEGNYYALGRLGKLFRSKNGIQDFEEGSNPFVDLNKTAQLRHPGLLLRNDTLIVLYSRIGDKPERIMMSNIPLKNDWSTWKASSPTNILEPEFDFEGVKLELNVSEIGYTEKVRELRDPDVYIENDKIYLLYTVQGENGIAISELKIK